MLEEENLIEPYGRGAIMTEEVHDFVETVDDRIDDIETKLTDMGIEDPANTMNIKN
jgi:predicted transcriptional regulator